jgi:hypothetical protein
MAIMADWIDYMFWVHAFGVLAYFSSPIYFGICAIRSYQRKATVVSRGVALDMFAGSLLAAPAAFSAICLAPDLSTALAALWLTSPCIVAHFVCR